MRQAQDYFGERELELVYIAKKLAEAKRLEDILDQAGLDYLVEPDKYIGGVILRRELIGAFFYVDASNLAVTHHTMQSAGFVPYLPSTED